MIPYRNCLKRTFDILFSSIGLLMLLPVFLVMAVWIKADSEGPVFYRQVRVGMHGKLFRIFKFRSMRLGSDKASQITIGERDSRITRSGIIIRKYKLDELPQLINVFIGDMSFVQRCQNMWTYIRRHRGMCWMCALASPTWHLSNTSMRTNYWARQIIPRITTSIPSCPTN